MINTLEVPAADAVELACGGDFSDKGWTVVRDEQIDSSRWESIHSLVFRDADGLFWEAQYRRGLTEAQEDDWFGYRVDPVPFRLVIPQQKQVVTTEYVYA